MLGVGQVCADFAGFAFDSLGYGRKIAGRTMNATEAVNQAEIASPLLVRQDSCQRSAWAFFLRAALLLLLLVVVAGGDLAATDVKVSFTLNTTDADGGPLAESRYYWISRQPAQDHPRPRDPLHEFRRR